MSAGFKAVQWNRRKLVYDAILLGCVVLFIGTFMLAQTVASTAGPVTFANAAASGSRSARSTAV